MSQAACGRWQLLNRQQRWFEVSWEDGQTIWLRSERGFDVLAPHKFLLHRHPSKSGNVIRSGLTRIVAWLWMYSSYTLKDWALFCQGYGMPIRLGMYGPEASDGDKRILWRAVQSIAGDVAAIIPKSMTIEFPSDKDRAAGTDLYLKRADWLDHTTSKVVLGGTAGTDAISGGHAVGKEHRQVEEDVERFDAFLLSNSITEQLVKWIITFSFGEQKAYPTVVVGREDKLPVGDVVEAINKLGGMGLKVKAKQIRELLQLEDPEPDDETVGGVPASITERVQVPAMPEAGKVELPNDTGAPGGGGDAPSTPPAAAAAASTRFLGSLLALNGEVDNESGGRADAAPGGGGGRRAARPDRPGAARVRCRIGHARPGAAAACAEAEAGRIRRGDDARRRAGAACRPGEPGGRAACAHADGSGAGLTGYGRSDP